MTLINKFYLSPYIAVFIATVVLCTIFFISADVNGTTEQTYEMTDHSISSSTAQHEQEKRTEHLKAQDDLPSQYKEDENVSKPLIAKAN